MLILIAGLVVFLGFHSLPILAGTRAGLVRQLGETPYKLIVVLGSFVGLVLIVWGFQASRETMVLWDTPKWLKHLILLLMVPVFPLLIAAYVPGKIKATVKHPMITAVKLWAFAHILANGTLPALLIFVAFLAWGVVDRISLKRRGAPSPAPVARFTSGDAIAVVVGLILYGLMLWRGHLLLIGVPVL